MEDKIKCYSVKIILDEKLYNQLKNIAISEKTDIESIILKKIKK